MAGERLLNILGHRTGKNLKNFPGYENWFVAQQVIDAVGNDPHLPDELQSTAATVSRAVATRLESVHISKRKRRKLSKKSGEYPEALETATVVLEQVSSHHLIQADAERERVPALAEELDMRRGAVSQLSDNDSMTFRPVRRLPRVTVRRAAVASGISTVLAENTNIIASGIHRDPGRVIHNELSIADSITSNLLNPNSKPSIRETVLYHIRESVGDKIPYPHIHEIMQNASDILLSGTAAKIAIPAALAGPGFLAARRGIARIQEGRQAATRKVLEEHVREDREGRIAALNAPSTGELIPQPE